MSEWISIAILILCMYFTAIISKTLYDILKVLRQLRDKEG